MRHAIPLTVIAGLFLATANAHAALLPPPDKRQPTVMPGTGDYVVIVHGWAWRRAAMHQIAKHFNRDGYHVVNINYDPRTEMPDEVTRARIAPAIVRHCTDPARKIHFVGHSMGCLMIRHYFKSSMLPNLGRAVYLAPPNQGIEIVDHVKDLVLFRKIFGDPARRLGTDAESIAKNLNSTALVETGIIMGVSRRVPVLSKLLPGEDDGIVSVESGKLDGMKDFLTVKRGHVLLPTYRPAMEQALHFVKHGRFSPAIKETKTRKRLVWPMNQRE